MSYGLWFVIARSDGWWQVRVRHVSHCAAEPSRIEAQRRAESLVFLGARVLHAPDAEVFPCPPGDEPLRVFGGKPVVAVEDIPKDADVLIDVVTGEMRKA